MAGGFGSGGAGAGGRLAHPVQQIFENGGVVVLLVAGGVEQGELPASVGQTVEFIERRGRFGLR